MDEGVEHERKYSAIGIKSGAGSRLPIQLHFFGDAVKADALQHGEDVISQLARRNIGVVTGTEQPYVQFLLLRAGIDGDGIVFAVYAAEAYRFAAPEFLDDRNLIQAYLFSIVVILRRENKIRLVPTRSESQIYASTGQDVVHCPPFNYLGRVVQRQRNACGTESDVLGLRNQMRRHDRRIGLNRTELGKVPLRYIHGGETCAISEQGNVAHEVVFFAI